MTDKVQKIREEVERLKLQLLRGACSSQIAMETMCKEEAYNEVLAILDTMQEEPKHRFNVGDKVQSVSGKIAKIESVGTDKYWCIGEQGMSIPFKYQDQWELVEKPKQCMYSKDNYTEEDRKVLCEGCEEKCEFNQVKESAEFQHVNDMCKENGNSLTQEPVSDDLEKAAEEYIKYTPRYDIEYELEEGNDPTEIECFTVDEATAAFIAGAKWKNENLWKPADGEDLPEIGREVVAFQEIFPTKVDAPSLFKIVVAHRPNPEGYDGKSIATGEVEHYTPKTYDKGGWNIPNVKYWLDCLMPKEIEL